MCRTDPSNLQIQLCLPSIYLSKQTLFDSVAIRDCIHNCLCADIHLTSLLCALWSWQGHHKLSLSPLSLWILPNCSSIVRWQCKFHTLSFSHVYTPTVLLPIPFPSPPSKQSARASECDGRAVVLSCHCRHNSAVTAASFIDHSSSGDGWCALHAERVAATGGRHFE